jgi:hypothetical protein
VEAHLEAFAPGMSRRGKIGLRGRRAKVPEKRDDSDRRGPSIEIPGDIDFMDNPGAAYADGEPLDLGEHGKLDPRESLESVVARARSRRRE